MAMEPSEGRSLRQELAEGLIGPAQAAWVAQELARALAEAHQHGIIHREIQPDNILIQRSGDVMTLKVKDFGFTRLTCQSSEPTQVPQGVGSSAYMPPEQVMSGKLDARSDVYSLGVVLYELVAGHVPFDGGPTGERLLAHGNRRPPPLPARGQPPGLEALIMQMLSRRPEDRPQNMSAVVSALRTLLAEREPPRPALVERAWAPAHQALRRPQSALWASAVGLVIGVMYWMMDLSSLTAMLSAR
jgi:serine/threonine-protein kinase